MAQITALRTGKGAGVRFHYELKDEFRKAFPRAKWNSYENQWEVGPTSAKRLEQWVAEIEASGVEAEIEARDSADRSAKEIEHTARELERIKMMIQDERRAKEAAIAARGRADEVRAQLEAARAELAAAAQEAADAKAAAEAAAADIDASVAHIATREGIRQTLRSMKRWMQMPKGQGKSDFYDAQIRLEDVRDKLTAIGVRCNAIEDAISANVNRPDRDLRFFNAHVEFVAA